MSKVRYQRESLNLRRVTLNATCSSLKIRIHRYSGLTVYIVILCLTSRSIREREKIARLGEAIVII